jgi:hypothetical protein
MMMFHAVVLFRIKAKNPDFVSWCYEEIRRLRKHTVPARVREYFFAEVSAPPSACEKLSGTNLPTSQT